MVSLNTDDTFIISTNKANYLNSVREESTAFINKYNENHSSFFSSISSFFTPHTSYYPWNFDCFYPTYYPAVTPIVIQSPPQVIVVNTSSQPTDKEKEEKEKKQKQMILGVILSTVGAFIATYSYKAFLTAKYAKETLEKDCNYFNESFSKFPEEDVFSTFSKSQLNSILSVHLKIHTLRYEKVQKYALAALGILTAGVFIVSGAYFNIPLFILLGELSLFAACLLAAGTLGWHWNDETTIYQMYKEILDRLNTTEMTTMSSKNPPTTLLVSPNNTTPFPTAPNESDADL